LVSPIRFRALLGILLALTAALYGVGLVRSPIHLHEAEILFGLHARAIAATLHDTEGRFLPLYFHMPAIGPNVWFHPMLVYLAAIVLRVAPFTEWAIRLPSVIVGLADIVLTYAVAWRVLRSRVNALLAAAMMALTPAHFIHSRLAMDYLYPVPFVLTWMWCVLAFDEMERWWLIALAGLVLGAGFYSYIAAVVFMPLYLLFTWVYLFAKYRRLGLAHLTVTAAFCLPLIVFVAWLRFHPDVFSGTTYRYALTRGGLAIGVLRLLNYNVMQEYVSLYWNFYNPTYLFLVGSPNVQSSTRAAGVFLMPLAVFLVSGILDLATRVRTRAAWLLVAGFFTAPIPAVFVEEPMAIYRELVVLPFAVIIAAFGVRRWCESTVKWRRLCAIVLLAAMPVQFGLFLENYFAVYPMNLYVWFGGNVKDTVARVLQLSAGREVPAVYLSTETSYVRERWHFYLAAAGREDFLSRTYVFDAAATVSDMSSGSLIVVPVIDHQIKDARMTGPAVRRVSEIFEPFAQRTMAFVVFERQ